MMQDAASIYKARPFPFNVGWYGFTFASGVYRVSTVLIGEELPSCEKKEDPVTGFPEEEKYVEVTGVESNDELRLRRFVVEDRSGSSRSR